jgi:adenosylhomocysteine nucleosidase
MEGFDLLIMETTGIIAAMQQESAAVLRLVSKWERSTLGPYRCQRFQLFERDCWLLTSGMGVKRARQAAHTLTRMISPQLLISVGVAGAVNDDLEIGDVVNARSNFLAEKGVLGSFQPLALLSEAARQTVAQALQPRRARFHSGTVITTRGSQFVQRQPGELENPILEMETAGIVLVSAEEGIPLLSLRAISDGPNTPIPFDLDKVMDEEYNLHIGMLIKTILGHPHLLIKFLRLGRNARQAAENAATALIAALSQPGPIVSEKYSR